MSIGKQTIIFYRRFLLSLCFKWMLGVSQRFVNDFRWFSFFLTMKWLIISLKLSIVAVEISRYAALLTAAANFCLLKCIWCLNRWDESLFPIWPTSECWECHTVTIKSIGRWWNWYHDANWHSQWYQIAVILCIAGDETFFQGHPKFKKNIPNLLQFERTFYSEFIWFFKSYSNRWIGTISWTHEMIIIRMASDAEHSPIIYSSAFDVIYFYYQLLLYIRMTDANVIMELNRIF